MFLGMYVGNRSGWFAKRRGPALIATIMATGIAAMTAPSAAGADVAAQPPTTHAMYVAVEGAARDDEAHESVRQAAKKLGLGPVETVDLPPLPEPKAPADLAAGVAKVRELAFDEGRNLLGRAVAEATQTGAAGLTQDKLCDLFLHSAMAIERVDWREEPEGGAPAVPPEAKEAYLQTAVLCPTKQLYQRTFPPLARQRFEQAVATARGRGQGTLVVRAAPDALVSVDGRPLAPAPLSLTMPFGDHFVRVERPGRLPWSQRLPLTLPRLELDVPAQNFRTFPDEEAVAHARRMSAAYALVAELKPGAETAVELRLVEVASGRRVDSTQVPLGRDTGGIHAAVMRFDEQARRRELLKQEGLSVSNPDKPALAISSAPLRTREDDGPRAREDPSGWARKRWPLLAAVGVVVATSLVLGLVVALDDGNTVQ